MRLTYQLKPPINRQASVKSCKPSCPKEPSTTTRLVPQAAIRLSALILAADKLVKIPRLSLTSIKLVHATNAGSTNSRPAEMDLGSVIKINKTMPQTPAALRTSCFLKVCDIIFVRSYVRFLAQPDIHWVVANNLEPGW